MISLEQLLDGLEVSVEPLAIQAVRRNHALDCGRIVGPTMHYALRGSGLLKLADGESVGVSARTVIVVPPGRQVQIVMKDGARRTATEVVVACLGIRATYQGGVGLFDHLAEPLVEHCGAETPSASPSSSSWMRSPRGDRAAGRWRRRSCGGVSSGCCGEPSRGTDTGSHGSHRCRMRGSAAPWRRCTTGRSMTSPFSSSPRWPA